MTAEIRARWAAVGVALGLLGGLTVAGMPADATDSECGQVILVSTVLTENIGPCNGPGLIIGNDDVTLDLNNHRVFGIGLDGEGPGILVDQRRNVEVRNGTVSNFDAGVSIEGGTGNRVIGVTAMDNVGNRTPETESPEEPTNAFAEYGDGIAIFSSTNNLIEGNTVMRNGPFAGIGVYELADPDHPGGAFGPTFGNIIRGNDVQANNLCRTPFGSCDDDGIRLEPGVEFNIVEGNTVTGSSLDGIAIFRTANDNIVRGNAVANNGHHHASHRPGDGIRVFSDRNVVENNGFYRNAGDGIAVGFRTPRGTVRPARNNRLLANDTASNGNPGSGGNFDLHDLNPGCDANVWAGNSYRTADPICTTG